MGGTVSETTTKVAGEVKEQVAQGVDWLTYIKDFIMNNGLLVLKAILIFIIGRYIALFIKKTIEQVLEKSNYDKTALNFITQIIYYAILALVMLSSLRVVGVPVDSFVTAFGAFGIAVGLALQSNMSNFASGLLILVTKPFKAGDWIAVDNIEGAVKSIQLLNTCIITKENRTIFIPNSIITSQKVTNSNYLPSRYLSLSFDIAYSNDHHQAIEVIKDVFRGDPRILNPEHVEIGIRSFGDNSVRLVAYPLVKTMDYLPVYYYVMSAIKDRFDEEGIKIPVQKQEVYIQRGSNMRVESIARPEGKKVDSAHFEERPEIHDNREFGIVHGSDRALEDGGGEGLGK